MQVAQARKHSAGSLDAGRRNHSLRTRYGEGHGTDASRQRL